MGMDKEKMKNEFGKILNETEEKAQYIKGAIKDKLYDAKERAMDMRDRTDRYIMDNPEKSALISLIIGVGAGVALSKFLRNRKRCRFCRH